MTHLQISNTLVNQKELKAIKTFFDCFLHSTQRVVENAIKSTGEVDLSELLWSRREFTYEFTYLWELGRDWLKAVEQNKLIL